MLRILSRTASSMVRSCGSVPVGRCDDVDLSTWELVNASQSDDEDLYSFDADDVTSDGDGDGTAEVESVPVRFECVVARSPPLVQPVEMTLDNHAYNGNGDVDDDIACGVDDDDAEDDDGGFDYDDELVPWKLKGKFGKQRLRKLGKRGGPNPNKSKKMPFYHNRPGCLYGKHGFGVQHSFI